MQKLTHSTVLFWFFVALNALPVCCFPFFPTMDGAAHLYNASIINQLQSGASEVVDSFYTINPVWVPNWTGHFVLSLLMYVLPAFMAEKILLILYVVGVPWSYQKLLHALTRTNQWAAYLIFPFIYNFLFCLGFYNSSLSIILLFVTLTQWIDYLAKPHSKKILYIGISFLLTYFSHPFTLVLLCMGVFGCTIVQRYQTIRLLLNRIGAMAMVGILPFGLLCYFYATQHFSGNNERLATIELIRYLTDVRPVISYQYEKELQLTQCLFWLYTGLIGYVVYTRTKAAFDPATKNNRCLVKNDVWLGFALLLLVLLFIIPNNASAGMMSDRLALFFFVFLLVWLAVQPFPKWVWRTTTTVVLVVNFGLVFRYMREVRNQNKLVAQCVQAAQYIRPNSVVLPLFRHKNWLAPHFSNYLGIEKPMVILENYETDTGWFPVHWREDRPTVTLGDQALPVCLYTQNTTTNRTTKTVDYVFILGHKNQPEPCNTLVDSLIDQQFKIVYQSADGEVRLYAPISPKVTCH
jgi:uncharacterized integral membrane protein